MMSPATRSSVEHSDGWHQNGYAINVSYISPGKVTGEMSLGSGPREGHRVRLGAIFSLADELTGCGVHESLPAGRKAVLTDAKTILYRPGTANHVRGEAVPIIASDDSTVWMARITDDEGDLIAVIAETFTLSDVPVRTAASVTSQGVRQQPAPAGKKAKPGKRPGLHKRADKRREQIALAASEVISRNGFANATIREIADAAGMHVPTMYQYLSSKDEVLELVYTQIMERIRSEFDAAISESVSTVDDLTRLLTTLLEISHHRQRQVGVLNRETKSLQPEARKRVISNYKALIQHFADVVQRGTETGEFRPVDSFIAANIIESLCSLWALRPFSFRGYSLEQYREEAIGFMMYGLASESLRTRSHTHKRDSLLG